MKDTEKPQWQPLSALPTVARDVQEQFAHSQELYAQLLKARDRPHILNDGLIERVIRLGHAGLEFQAVDISCPWACHGSGGMRHKLQPRAARRVPS